MPKNITIIGGGISGLTVLHYLKQKYAQRSDVQIRLLEKENSLGGTIRSIRKENFLFETGPNGFLASKETTLDLINALGIRDKLLAAKSESKKRFMALNNKLFSIPLGPISFLLFKPFSIFDKLRILREVTIPKNPDPGESVYDFAKRRLGTRFAELFIDPMIKGIFGGNARELNLKCAIPRIYELEEMYGSLFKAMFALAKQKRKEGEKEIYNGLPKGQLTSFQNGMGELIDALSQKYRDSICQNEEVCGISRSNNRFILQTTKGEYSCEEVFLCAPAYAGAHILFSFNKTLAEALKKIYYAPIAVVGLAYRKTAFEIQPDGFGYLIPSQEKKDVLGVLFSSQIFQNRSDANHVLLQVMIGGAGSERLFDQPQDKILELAKNEIKTVLEAKQDPVKEFYSFWQKGIPQYNLNYPELTRMIEQEASKIRGFFLCANYIGGISVNDCIAHAKLAAEKSSL